MCAAPHLLRVENARKKGYQTLNYGYIQTECRLVACFTFHSSNIKQIKDDLSISGVKTCILSVKRFENQGRHSKYTPNTRTLTQQPIFYTYTSAHTIHNSPAIKMRNAENYVRIRFHLERKSHFMNATSRFFFVAHPATEPSSSSDYLLMHADQHLLHMVLHLCCEISRTLLAHKSRL